MSHLQLSLAKEKKAVVMKTTGHEKAAVTVLLTILVGQMEKDAFLQLYLPAKDVRKWTKN